MGSIAFNIASTKMIPRPLLNFLSQKGERRHLGQCSWRMKKLPKRAEPFVFVLLMAGIMSGVLSLVNVLLNIGFGPGFWLVWLKAWGFSFVVAYPVAYFSVLFVRRIMRRLF